ncbi:MAG: hypothetical protein IPJ13_15700 [Saprospiraceae bacterium]|nr:hypothetical protein [Saprospiraceae bacterium]
MVGVIRYNEGEYEKAVAGFSNYLSKYPSGINKIKAHYYRAESNTLLKKYDTGLEDYELLIKSRQFGILYTITKKAALIAYNYTQSFDKAYRYYDLYYSQLTDEDENLKAATGALRSAFRNANSEGIKKHANIVVNSKKADNEDKSTAYYYLAKTWYKDKSEKCIFSICIYRRYGQAPIRQQKQGYMMAEILYKQNK